MRNLSMRALCAFGCTLAAAAFADGPNRPFPQHTTYSSGTIKPSHRTQAQLDDDVRAAYDRWKTNYLLQAGTEPDGRARYRVSAGVIQATDTVSEGQGYGMVIVPLMAGYDPDAQTIFDGLWEYFNDHRSNVDGRLMDWHIPPSEASDDASTGDDSAFDGDADIALGLILADRQWGSTGRIDYAAEAADVCAGLLASEIGPDSRLPLLGDWVSPAGPRYNQYTNRSSDLLMAHFRSYARFTGDSAWTTVATNSLSAIDRLQSGYAAATGLLPDFFVPVSTTDHSPKPANANFLEGPHDGAYYYNAGRDPWRIATDALVNGDAGSLAAARLLSHWAESATGGQAPQIKPGYNLNGTLIPPGNYFTSFFAAPLGVAAMLDPAQQSWLNAIDDAVRSAHEGYYEDTVTLQCLIVMSGNYWDPAPAAACLADLDHNGVIDLSDLGLVLAGFGVNDAGDVDGDGDTDLSDLGVVLADFDSSCP